MAPSREWVLAMSFVDTSFQRNPLAFEIYRRLGGWAPETRYVNLRWGSKDFGLYYIGEKVQFSPGRLQLPSEGSGDGILLQIDWPKAGERSVKSKTTGTTFQVAFPKNVTHQQLGYIQQLVDEVDGRAAAGVHSPEAAKSLEEVLDFASFTRYFMLQELAIDLDGYAFSDYVEVKDGRLSHAAPWDHDLAFGFACKPDYRRNALTGHTSSGVEGWNVENVRDAMTRWSAIGFQTIKAHRNMRQLFLNLWRTPSFAAYFVAAWRSARQGPLRDEALEEMVSRRSSRISASAWRDLAIWHDAERPQQRRVSAATLFAFGGIRAKGVY
ncbi:unnamed protein product [Polarella glacialis]|uniref:Uncharacterized protein n=1 Tax=Polarella glacialis TaxID=89957 RepID=A0A813G281_POLGL|nr:unnamed protein product [Polarella glacialis]